MPNLFIDIEARFAKFQDSLDQIQRRADKFSSGLTRSFGTLSTVLGGIGLALGGGALVTQFQQIVDAADALDEASQRTGVSVEALSELRFVAEQNGTTFEKLEDGFKRLAVAIDDNNDAFRRLGLDPKQFTDVEDALGAVAEQFAKIKSPGDQAALAVQLFGKAGTDLLPLLKLGKQGIEEFREEARRLGLTLSSEFAGAAGDFNDNIAKLSGSLAGFGRSLANTAIGPLNDFIERVLKIKQISGSFFGDFFLESPADLFRSTDDSIKETEKNIKSLTAEIAKLQALLSGNKLSGLLKFDAQNRLSSLRDDLVTSRQRLELLQFDKQREVERSPLRQLQRSAEAATADDGGFVPGVRDPKDTKTDRVTVRSDFDTLRDSLTRQLQSEKRLTEELTLVEDKRFQALKRGQRDALVGIARQIDTLRAEEEARKNLDAGESAASSIASEQLTREISAIESRKSALTQAFEDNALSATDYYSQIAVQEERAASLRLSNLQEQKAAQEALAADTSSPVSDRFSALSRIESINTQIIAQERELVELEERNARAISRSSDELLRRKIEISQQVNQTLGIQNPELDRAALLDQFRDLPEDFKQTVTFQAFIDTALAEKQISDFERRTGTIDTTLRLTEERASIDQTAGISTESETREKILVARRKAVVEIEQEISKFEQLRQAQGAAFGPEQEARIEAQRNRLAELKATTEDYLFDVRAIGQDATADFFSSFLKGGEEAINAIDRLGEAIERNLLNKVGDELADQLFTGFGNLTNPRKQGQEGAQGGFTDLLSSGANAFGGFLGGFGGKPQGLSERQTTDAISLAGDAGAAELGTAALDSTAAVEQFTGSLLESAPEVGGSLLDLSSSALEGQIATQSFSAILPTASAAVPQLVAGQSIAGAAATDFALQITLAAAAAQEAATQFAIAAATAQAASAGAGGFAKGGVFEGGVQAFADGGIIGAPTNFLMPGGNIGLMGEAGPEAIMPLTMAGGALSVHAITVDGKAQALPVGRNAAGLMSVQLPAQITNLNTAGDSVAYRNLSELSILKSAIDNSSYQAILDNSQTIGGTDARVWLSPSWDYDEEIIKKGSVQAFATGGIVSSPTTFPMAGGKTGLMGEAGPEAIMPLSKRGGGFAVHAIAEDGTEDVLSLTRNASGKLAVRLPSASASKAFALGGVFESGAESLSMKFTDGAVLTAAAQRFASLPFHAYAIGGVANKPQIAMFGEGSRPEAFVPLPDGKTIPVTMDGPVGGGITLIQNITTDDANSFRRSRASIFNDANAGLAAASSRA